LDVEHESNYLKNKCIQTELQACENVQGGFVPPIYTGNEKLVKNTVLEPLKTFKYDDIIPNSEPIIKLNIEKMELVRHLEKKQILEKNHQDTVEVAKKKDMATFNYIIKNIEKIKNEQPEEYNLIIKMGEKIQKKQLQQKEKLIIPNLHLENAKTRNFKSKVMTGISENKEKGCLTDRNLTQQNPEDILEESGFGEGKANLVKNSEWTSMNNFAAKNLINSRIT